MERTPQERIFQDATRVEIDPSVFGVDGHETDPDMRAQQLRDAALLSGVMWQASITLVDRLFQDVLELHARPQEEWVEAIKSSHVLSTLPQRFWHRMTPEFANRFAVATADLTGRVSRGWTEADCVAHELALRCLFEEMETLSQVLELPLPEGWRADLEEELFEDADHELLYQRAFDGFEDDDDEADGVAPMRFEDWFKPFTPDQRLPPFLESSVDQ